MEAVEVERDEGCDRPVAEVQTRRGILECVSLPADLFHFGLPLIVCLVYSVFIENHDQARSVTRFGNDSPEWRAISAKMLAILQTTQTGTLYVYQGEEIGMNNFPRSWGIEEYKDVATINYWNL